MPVVTSKLPKHGLLKTANRIKPMTETRAAPNQAKNNVTSRVRLDEKYAARRALLKVAHQKPQFARVCEVFLQRDARLESSFSEIPLAQRPTHQSAREPKNHLNEAYAKPSDQPQREAPQAKQPTQRH